MFCKTIEMPAKLLPRFKHLKIAKPSESIKSTKFLHKSGKFIEFQENGCFLHSESIPAINDMPVLSGFQ